MKTLIVLETEEEDRIRWREACGEQIRCMFFHGLRGVLLAVAQFDAAGIVLSARNATSEEPDAKGFFVELACAERRGACRRVPPIFIAADNSEFFACAEMRSGMYGARREELHAAVLAALGLAA